MLVAQLTDLHLGPDGDRDLAANAHRFLSCLDTVRTLLRQPDLYLITGDIADRGDEDSYRLFLKAMRSIERPWLCVMGNHDRAASFTSAVARDPSDHFHKGDVFSLGDWRVVGIDTSLAGLEGGYFDEARADRLATTLAAHPDAPTIIAMHHPPVASGVEWIDPVAGAGWIKRFGAVVARFAQVRQIVCGHVHMAVMTRFQGIPVSIAPATAPQLWPETAPFDHHRPDGRMLVIDGQPGFALHRLGADGVSTTFAAPAMGQVRLRNGPLSEGDVAVSDHFRSGQQRRS